MNRTKVKPYWLIKEDRHDEQRWRRQYKPVRMRYKQTWDDIRFWSKPLILHHRPFYGRYKQYDGWKKLVRASQKLQDLVYMECST